MMSDILSWIRDPKEYRDYGYDNLYRRKVTVCPADHAHR